MTTPILTPHGTPKAIDPTSIRRMPAGSARAAEIAKQFEAMLIHEVIKGARAAGGGDWLGEGSEQSSEAAVQMGEEFLAGAMASAGGLGLANVLRESLAKTVGNVSAGSTAP